jgi:RIO kinase 1
LGRVVTYNGASRTIRRIAPISSIKIPASIAPLIEDGIVDEVIRQLKSGKEATVYLVRCGDELRCAKVYKEANKRSFRQAVEYREGRKVKNSRRARAMERGSRYGRSETESAWQSAEVQALYRLSGAGVRVPRPFGFYDGVLLMELVAGEDGLVAPRLADVELHPALAAEYHRVLLQEVVRMLCAGLVHGDLSEFNILVGADGPVIIDLPQAVDAAGNNHAARMLERDVDNLANYLGQFVPELRGSAFGKEIWQLYEAGTLTPASPLTGVVEEPSAPADVDAVLREIEEVRAEALLRLERLAEHELNP